MDDMITITNTDTNQIPSFIPDNQPLTLPFGTEIKYANDEWGLYVNGSMNVSFLVRRAKSNGILGWRITIIPGIMTVKYADNFINTTCRGCLDSLKGV